MRATPYSDITALDPEWLWSGRIPMSWPTLIAGDGGIGKGFLLSDIVSRVTRGAPMPGMTEGTDPASVLLITSEDDPSLAMAHRLRAAGADMSRVYDMTDDFMIPESLPALRDAIREIGDVRLIVIDPLSAVASVALTSSNVRVRRQIMNPLERLTKDCGVAMAVVHHTVKSGRVAGNKGITDAARIVLKISRAAADDKIRLIHVDKSNIASDTSGDIAYTVAGKFPNVRVRYLDAPPADEPADIRPPSVADKVLAALQSSPDPIETHRLADITGEPYGTVRVALTRLKAAQRIVQTSRGHWHVPTDGAPDLRVV